MWLAFLSATKATGLAELQIHGVFGEEGLGKVDVVREVA